MARLAVADGISVVACTPHRGYTYDHHARAGPRRDRGAAAADRRSRIPLRLVSGLEIAIDRRSRWTSRSSAPQRSGATGRWLLIEMPSMAGRSSCRNLLDRARGAGVQRGHRPPRALTVGAGDADRMRDIVGRGAILQLTAASLTGENGHRPLRCAEHLLHVGFAHIIASDTHSPTRRPPGLAEGLKAAALMFQCQAGRPALDVDEVPRAVPTDATSVPPRLPGAPKLEPVKKRDRSAPRSPRKTER